MPVSSCVQIPQDISEIGVIGIFHPGRNTPFSGAERGAHAADGVTPR
jgi:hypothetical protein